MTSLPTMPPSKGVLLATYASPHAGIGVDVMVYRNDASAEFPFEVDWSLPNGGVAQRSCWPTRKSAMARARRDRRMFDAVPIEPMAQP